MRLFFEYAAITAADTASSLTFLSMNISGSIILKSFIIAESMYPNNEANCVLAFFPLDIKPWMFLPAPSNIPLKGTSAVPMGIHSCPFKFISSSSNIVLPSKLIPSRVC